jgi:inorganic pyrophosphatase
MIMPGKLTLLPAFHKKPNILNVIIETPRGCRNKYAYDQNYGLFKLKKVLPLGTVFPFEFGFVPSTQGEDGDPLDILLIMEEPTYPGCLVSTTLIGVIEASQSRKGKKVRNDRLVGVAEKAQLSRKIRSLKDLDEKMLTQIEEFFTFYNKAEGKAFRVMGRGTPTHARRLVAEGMEKFSKPSWK